MALIKDFDTPFGASLKASYHRVDGYEVLSGKRVEVRVASYLSQEDRVDGRSPVSMHSFSFETDSDPDRADLYEMLKGTDEFTDATDI